MEPLVSQGHAGSAAGVFVNVKNCRDGAPDTSKADLLFDYLAHAPYGAELLEGVMIGGVDYNDLVKSKGKKITLRLRECFAAR